MKKIIALYTEAFGGLSRSAWMLSVVMLINRSGTMVLPFLSVYLTTTLGFTIEETGYVLSSYGLGSLVGAYLGGAFSDRYGHFIVQFLSLVISGVIFIVISDITSFYGLVSGIFILSLIAESLRPANASSISFYSKPENISRSFSLNRMAINLGFSIGPAIGGLLAAISYKLLFLADGFTCIAAGVFFYFYFSKRKGHQPDKESIKKNKEKGGPVFRDYRFLAFVILSSFFAILFFQLFMTLPLYYREVYQLSEKEIGGLLALNGIVVFSLEMVLVYILNKRFQLHRMIFVGMVLVGLSFAILNIYHGIIILVISMVILSIAEIFAMPFMATFTVQRSSKYNRGAYMGLYTIAYSIAYVIAPILGAFIISKYGFNLLWWGTGIASVIIAFGFLNVTRPQIRN